MSPVHLRGVLRVVCLLPWVVACTPLLSPDADPLDGTSWMLETYAKSTPIPGSTITAAFEQGELSGSAGCNTYRGAYAVHGERIEITDVAWTLMACLEPAGVMEQEQRVMEFLVGVERFRIERGKLVLQRADQETLVFVTRGQP